MKFILPFLFLLVSCSNKINNFAFEEKCLNLQRTYKKVAANKDKRKIFYKRGIERIRKLQKQGLDYKTDDLYRANNKKLYEIRMEEKKLDKEENKSYKELFLTIGLPKKIVLRNMSLLSGGKIREKIIKKDLKTEGQQILYDFFDSAEVKNARKWYIDNSFEARDYCKEFGIDVLEPK